MRFRGREAQRMLAEAETNSDLNRMIEARTDGVPLEQILGWAEFRGLRVGIAPGIFVPRYKTEFLVEKAIALGESESVVLDLCCGSGAIGLAIISNNSSIQLLASDIIRLRIQRRNIISHLLKLKSLKVTSSNPFLKNGKARSTYWLPMLLMFQLSQLK